MKGFLTFTLAAGVAITTTSIAQAAVVGKVPLNVDRSVFTEAQAPMSGAAMGRLTLDRASLNRELNRLGELLAPVEEREESDMSNTATSRKSMVWSY